MGKILNEIGPKEVEFISSQKVFFVGTAPLASEHYVSVSPKAPGNACVVIDPHTVAYADLTGSGAETAAHVLQNGRMTLMFCNLEDGPPKILRLSGHAQVLFPEKNVSHSMLSKFPKEITSSPGFRAVYKLDVTRISTSCGFSLPIMDFKKFRSTLKEITEKDGKKGISDYITLKNSFSIHGLPSIGLVRPDAPQNIVPVEEEGFIFGKVLEGDKTLSISTSNAQLLYRKKQKINLRPFEIIVGALTIFVAGIVTGLYCANIFVYDLQKYF